MCFKGSMRIATWNVNSIKQRLDHLLRFLKEAQPDVICLQELKCVDDAFPRAEVEGAGYNVETHGQKAYNGVALLAKRPIEEVRRNLPGEPDEQARYLEAVISTAGGAVRVASIYLPNGNPTGTPKFDYKLAWMDRLKAHAGDLLKAEEPVVLAGDLNIIPEPRDARYPQNWVRDALFQPESRAKFRETLHLGYGDALRLCDDGPGLSRSGITRPAPGRRTTASASITCSCRRRPPTGWSGSRCTRRRAAGTSRRTTCRSRSSSMCENAGSARRSALPLQVLLDIGERPSAGRSRSRPP